MYFQKASQTVVMSNSELRTTTENMFSEGSFLDYLNQNHPRDMLKIKTSRFVFNMKGMRLESWHFLQAPQIILYTKVSGTPDFTRQE